MLDTARGIGAHQVGDMAASLAYYALFALFPLLLGLIVILSFFLDQEVVRGELETLLAKNLPGAQEIVTRNLDNVVRLRGAIGLVAFAGLLWSGSAVFGALTRILDRTWEVRDRHAFHIVRARSLVMLVGVAALVVLSLSSTTLLQLAAELAEVERLGALGTFLASGARLLLQGSSLVGSLLVPTLLYRFAPSERIAWREVLPGALLAGLLFEAAKNVFVLYLSRFASFDLVYGSLASVIILLFWVYISGFILILGAEFGAALGRRRKGRLAVRRDIAF